MMGTSTTSRRADARNEAERSTARAEADAAKLRDDARHLADELVEPLRHSEPQLATTTVRMSKIELEQEEAGRVDEVVGLVVRATVPGVSLGELVRIDSQPRPVTAEVVGFRGEHAELLGDELAPARAKTIVVCATSDAPPLVRLRAVHVATAIAEWFREKRGASVLLLVDSLTRVARAQREVGLSAGEPPARHGYPPRVFALLPRVIARAGAP